MNKDDRKILSQVDEGISGQLVAIEELIQSLEERIERIQETFPDGNHVSEQLEQERDTLQEIMDSIEDAKSSLGEYL